MTNTPIFINAKDRVTFLRALIHRLRDQGYSNIKVVDTGSTYPPMKEFLKGLGHEVFYCLEPDPFPHAALWSCGALKAYGYEGKRFVYTDCDVVPDKNCPRDWLDRLHALLDKYPDKRKVGLGLRIDNLPEHYARKAEVVAWESRWWQEEVEPGVFACELDTTLALYREDYCGAGFPGTWCPASLRTGPPFVANHLPWHADSSRPTEEETYYREHKAPGVGMW